MVKNILALQHHIDAKRIRTYECSNKIVVTDTAFIDPSFEKLDLKNIEAKQRMTQRILNMYLIPENMVNMPSTVNCLSSDINGVSEGQPLLNIKTYGCPNAENTTINTGETILIIKPKLIAKGTTFRPPDC